jgi:hypothetical protein
MSGLCKRRPFCWGNLDTSDGRHHHVTHQAITSKMLTYASLLPAAATAFSTPSQLELSRHELLLSTHAPQLHQHLLDAGLPALLYAAQWLMTCYACPFPIHVAARVLDVLLQVCKSTGVLCIVEADLKHLLARLALG